RELPPAFRGVELEAERRQLDRDVGVEPPLRDLLEGALVVEHGLLGLLAACDVLSEHVEGRHAALGAQARDAAHRVLEALAGDVARRDAAHDRLGHERQRADDDLVERLHAASLSISRREARAKHHTVTDGAPASARRRAHSRAVAPEVATSSISSTPPAGRSPARKARGKSARKAPRTLAARPAARARLWTSVSRVLRRRPRRKGSSRRSATAAPRTSAGWYPRARRERSVAGTAATSTQPSGACSRRTISAASRGPR